MVFSCIGFCSLSSLFSVATYVVGACCCCRSASPRNAFHVARRCLCAFVDWHNVIVEKTVVCSFCCMAINIVAFLQVLFAFALPLLWKRDGGQTTGKMNGTMKRLLLQTVENISVPPCLVSFFFLHVLVLLVVLVVVLVSHRSQRKPKA